MAERGRNLGDDSVGSRPLVVTVINGAYFATKLAEHVVCGRCLPTLPLKALIS